MNEVQLGHVLISELIHEVLHCLFVEGADWDLTARDYRLAKVGHLRETLTVRLLQVKELSVAFLGDLGLLHPLKICLDDPTW